MREWVAIKSTTVVGALQDFQVSLTGTLLAQAGSMNSTTVRVLRVSGLPWQMASRAIDSVLGNDRDVLAIDAIEPGPDDPHADVLHVLVEERAVDRVRRKLATGFTFVCVEDVTDSSAAARTPSARIHAATVSSAPLCVRLETRERRNTALTHPSAA